MTYDPIAEGASCYDCPLQGRTVVPPEPPRGKLRLIVIGEGPGTSEVRARRPFVGPSGRHLDAAIREAGGFRADCFVTNAVLCKCDDEKELETAIACCSMRLAREIAKLPSDTPILSLGAAASRVTIGKSGIQRYRGFVWKAPEIKPTQIRNAERLYEKRIEKKRKLKDVEKALNSLRLLQARQLIAGRVVVPTVHPAFILRGADTWLPVYRTDIKRAWRLAHGKLTLDQLADGGVYQLATTAREARKLLRGFGKLVNLDLETDGPDPMRAAITCAAVADINDLSRIVVMMPWKPAMATLLKKFLKKRTVVTHNGPAFDVIVCAERHGIEFGKNEDTLVAHRSFASHMPQALAHVGSVYTDTGPWKLRFKNTEEKGAVAGFGVKEEDLPEYNAADVRIGSLAWLRMQPDLDRERAVYEEDMQMAALYTSMQRTGLYVDVARRDRLAKRLKHRAAALIGEMREMLRRPAFKPTPNDIRRALYKQLRAPTWLAPFTPTGLPSTAALVLEQLRGSDDFPAAGKLADLILRYRSASDARSEYLDVYIHTDGRVHPSWKQVETGRPATRNPNILNIPRMAHCQSCGVLLLDGCTHGPGKKGKAHDEPQPEEQLRDIYCAPPGYKWVYFDLSQAEMRFAAHLSADPVFIASCSKDIHTENACILFPDGAELIRSDPKGKGARFRDIAKTCGFAVAYGAEAMKIFATLKQKGFDVDLDDVEAMLENLKSSYKVFYGWAHSTVDSMNRHGHLVIPFSNRKRWVGFHAKPNLGFNCLDDQTEALTQRGWIKGFDLKVGDKLLTRKLETGLMEWKPIQRMYKWPKYKGPLIEFKSNTFNAVTTPEHRWPAVNRKTGQSVCVTSEYLSQGARDESIYRTGNYEPSVTSVYTDDFVELVGWVLTDGSIQHKKSGTAPRVNVCQSVRGNPDKAQRVDNLVYRLDPTVMRCRTGNRGLVTWSFRAESTITKTITKLFPERTLTHDFLFALNKIQLRLLLDVMLLGDGWSNYGLGGKRDKFVCRDKERADVFQFLCTLNGIATTSTYRGPFQSEKQYASMDNRPKSSGCWAVSLLRRETIQVIVHKRRYGRHKKPINQVRHYTAATPIWCPVVPNTFFVARRHGDVFVTGNTPVQGAVASVMNKRLLELERRKTKGAQLIIYHYDAAIYETPDDEVADMERIVSDLWKEPIVAPNGLSWVQKIDQKVVERWSQS